MPVAALEANGTEEKNNNGFNHFGFGDLGDDGGASWKSHSAQPEQKMNDNLLAPVVLLNGNDFGHSVLLIHQVLDDKQHALTLSKIKYNKNLPVFGTDEAIFACNDDPNQLVYGIFRFLFVM